MELKSIRFGPSPASDGRVRLTGEVTYDDQPGQFEEYWFEVDGDLAGSLSRTGNPWLVCLVPLAAKLGEPLRIGMPVDPLLVRNVQELTAIWRSWDPSLHRVEVLAGTADGVPPVRGSRTAAFFSGGVDSFFTLLRSAEPDAIRIDDLITIRGFDISLKNTVALARRKARIASIAESLGKRTVDVATNLRSTRLKEADWGSLWHACGLASVGLALEGRYRRLVIAATHRYGDLIPLGSHPLTDPLLSTSRTEVLHDGATHDRLSKLEYVARHDVALSNLHVCFRHASDVNCGACEKCLRTMAGLEVLGRLEGSVTFPQGGFAPGKDLARLSEHAGPSSLLGADPVGSPGPADGRTSFGPSIGRCGGRVASARCWLRRSGWGRDAWRGEPRAFCSDGS